MNVQLFTDKLAISLSTICVLHCLFMPSFLILSSWFAAFSLNNEFVHYAILFAAVPVSAYALVKGFFGEIGEKSLTVLGSLFVIYAHYKNHQICKELDCDCHEA